MLGKLLDKFEAAVILTAVTLITLIITANVFSRYFFHVSMASASELTGFLLVWLSMIAAASAFKHRQHSGVDLFVRFLPESIQLGIMIFMRLVTIGYFVLLAYAAMTVTISHMQQGRLSPALRVPIWLVTLGILIGALLACVRVTQALVEDTRKRGS